MEIALLVLVVIIVFIVVYNKQKNKTNTKVSKTLEKYFKNSDFSKISSIEELKEKLEIKGHKKFQSSVNHILEDSKHKIDIFQEYRLKHNLLYNELSFLKVVANCVIDYSLKKNYSINDSIKVLVLTFSSENLSDLVGKEADKDVILDNFYAIIDGFIKRHNDKLKEIE